MTGITIGVCIALICIIICAFIIVCRGKNRYPDCLIVVLIVFVKVVHTDQPELFLDVFAIVRNFYLSGNFQLLKPTEEV